MLFRSEGASEAISREPWGMSAFRSAEAERKTIMSDGRESKPHEGMMMALFL